MPSAVTCPCGSYIDNFTVINRKNGWRRAFFKCKEKNCKAKINLSKLTVFENTKLKFHQIILLMYCFCQFLTYDKTINEVSEIPDGDFHPTTGEPYITSTFAKLGRTTVARFFTQFRAWICAWCIQHQSTKKIGGVGKTVEIDESKFGKRKYGKGRIRSRRNAWVLGGICREDGDLFLVECPGNKRNRATLIPIILQHVEVGT